jgi:hypothetical protein
MSIRQDDTSQGANYSSTSDQQGLSSLLWPQASKPRTFVLAEGVRFALSTSMPFQSFNLKKSKSKKSRFCNSKKPRRMQSIEVVAAQAEKGEKNCQ